MKEMEGKKLHRNKLFSLKFLLSKTQSLKTNVTVISCGLNVTVPKNDEPLVALEMEDFLMLTA